MTVPLDGEAYESDRVTSADIMEMCSRWATGSSFYIMKTAKMMLVFRKNSVFL